MGASKDRGNWSVRVIKELWQVGIDSWIHRNEELYGKTAEERIAKIAKEVNDKIRKRSRESARGR